MGRGNTIEAVPVPAEELEPWLESIEWHLDQFCSGGHHEPQDIIDQIMDKERQLWLAVDGGKVKCALLTMVAADRLKTCTVTHAAGEDFRAWLHLWELIENWARDIGCRNMKAEARPGWERPLARFGMKKTHVVLEKRL